MERDYSQTKNLVDKWFEANRTDDPALMQGKIRDCRAAGAPDGELLLLLLGTRKRFPASCGKTEIDRQVSELLSGYPIVESISPDLAGLLPAAVFYSISGNHGQALTHFIEDSENAHIPDPDAEAYILFGMNLSAGANDADYYIYFKKTWIAYLLSSSRYDDADAVINELSHILPDDEDISDFRRKLHESAYFIRDDADSGMSAQYRRLSRNGCDDEFYALISRLETETREQLLASSADSAAAWKSANMEYYDALLEWYNAWYRISAFSPDDSAYLRYFGDLYDFLKANSASLRFVYENFADYRSKLSFKVIVQHWLTFHPDIRKSGIEATFMHYFDLDVIKCDENEVFVDCGCYTGDTVLEYISQYGKRYKSIYSYELTASTFETAKKNLEGLDRVYLRNAGVSNTNGTLRMVVNAGDDGSANRLRDDGSVSCDVVRIDDDIEEDITFIKMDIEGAEADALMGAERQIKRNKPKLAISLYHKKSDIINIPLLIKQMVPEYKLYIRNTSAPGFPFPTEYVLLAVVDG